MKHHHLLVKIFIMKKIKKQIFRNIRNKMELEKSGKTKEEIQESQNIGYGFSIILVTIIEILIVVYYIKIGNIIGNTAFKILSAMQIATVVYNYFCAVTLNPYSENIEDYKFRRIPLLINTILDYIYYVGVILYAIGWYK